jgi:hypothetical protein
VTFDEWLFWTRWCGMRQLPHGTDEAVTSPGNRFNERGVLAQGLSQEEDVIGEAPLLDESVRPERCDELVLLHQVSAISDQEKQGVERFRRE